MKSRVRRESPSHAHPQVGTIGPGWREDLKGVEEPGCRRSGTESKNSARVNPEADGGESVCRKLLEKTEKPSMAKSGAEGELSSRAMP